MALTDTAEYWQDVKREKRIFCHLKSIECGHYHLRESDCLPSIDCYACLKIISKDPELEKRLKENDRIREKKYERKRAKKKGIRLNSVIKFGKYKGKMTTLEMVIKNDPKYFEWMKDKFLFHPEVQKHL